MLLANEKVDWKFIYLFLSSKIKNKYGVFGLMGNLKAESGGSSVNLQNSFQAKLGVSDIQYTNNVDSGIYTNFVKDSAGYGLAQWTFWTRKQALWNYCKSKGASIGNLQSQLEFLWSEIQARPVVLSGLLTAKSVRDASDVVVTQFEKPKNQSDSVKVARATYGMQFYNEFIGNNENGGMTTMSVLCGWASIGDGNRASGGVLGDQTGKEVKLGPWYDFGQGYVIRWKDRSLAARYASKVKGICLNEKVGYDQSKRTSLFEELRSVGWDTKMIKNPCATDCSQLAATAANSVGVKVSKDLYSGNIVDVFKSTGLVDILTDVKYTKSPDYLLTGDILVAKGHHVISVLADGAKVAFVTPQKGGTTAAISNEQISISDGTVHPAAAKSKDSKIAGTYKTTSELRLRGDASLTAPIIGVMKDGATVKCYGYYSTAQNEQKWYLVAIGSYTGFASSAYLKRV